MDFINKEFQLELNHKIVNEINELIQFMNQKIKQLLHITTAIITYLKQQIDTKLCDSNNIKITIANLIQEYNGVVNSCIKNTIPLFLKNEDDYDTLEWTCNDILIKYEKPYLFLVNCTYNLTNIKGVMEYFTFVNHHYSKLLDKIQELNLLSTKIELIN